MKEPATKSIENRRADSAISRVVIVTTQAPPAATGQGRILDNLFGAYDALFIAEGFDQNDRSGNAAANVGVVTSFSELHSIAPYPDSLECLRKAIDTRTSEIVEHCKRFKPEVLIACSHNFVNLPAAALAARKLELPLVVYLFDDPLKQWKGLVLDYVKQTELSWATESAAIIVPNEVLATSVWKRMGVAAHIVPNGISDNSFNDDDSYGLRQPDRIRIVYTGSVYEAQADAVIRVNEAIESSHLNFQLHLYTAQSEESLRRQNVHGEKIVRHGFEEGDRVYAQQQQADVLLLPLAFSCDYPEVVRTASPAKLGEFLASGRPILAHAPADSFVAKFIAKHNCGLVVADASVEKLRDALSRLACDEELRRALGRSGRKAAELFRLSRCRRKLDNLLTETVFLRGLRDNRWAPRVQASEFQASQLQAPELQAPELQAPELQAKFTLGGASTNGRA